MKKTIDGQVAIVTGGALGIGEAVARRLASEGASVVVADVDVEGAQRVVDDIEREGGTAWASRCDVSDPTSVEQTVEETAERFSQLDILINNAGIVFKGKCAETTDSDWQRVIAVNLTGTFLCCKYVIPKMLANGGGSIVNVSALGGLVGVAGRAAYMSAKAAVLGLTRSITFDYAREGIRCNAVCPGTTRTPMVERVAQEYPDPEAFLSHVTERQFIGRMAEPTEIADAIFFLASPLSSYVYGVYLAVDGGVTATSPR